MIHGLETAALQLDGASGRAFFEQLLKDTQQGFFADPIYGGNRDMVRLEDDRLSRRPLRLPRLGRAATTSAIRTRRSASAAARTGPAR